MEIIVRRVDLARELQLVQGIVERKNSIPILSNILAEASNGELRIAATDLDVSVRTACPAQVLAEGSITLAAKKLFEIVRSLPEADIHVKLLPDSWAAVDCERVSFKMAGLPREDFPALPEAKATGGIALPAEALRDLIARTAFAITTEDARYYLAGALLLLEPDAISMVATDGHRLAYARSQATLVVGEPKRVLVPRKAIQELGRLLEGQEQAIFQEIENHLVFSVGGRTLASKTIEGQFPAFEKVIAVSGGKVVDVDRERLATAIRRVSLLSAERTRAVRLALSNEKLQILASSPDLGEANESLAIEYKGDVIDIGFNAQYLLDFLGVVGTDSVHLELKDAESQGVLKPASEGRVDYRYIVMPMRL